MIVFLICMAPVATFFYVVLKGDWDNMKKWKDYKNMKTKVDFEEKRRKARRFFDL